MKKIISAMLAVSAVLLFASCKNDKNQPKDKEKADAYISFTFNLPQSGFRDVTASNAGDEYAGTADEQAINAVRVVLYDPTSAEVKYSFDYSITSNGTAAPTGDVAGTPTVAQFTTKAKEVVSQEYQMLAIINPTSAIKAATAEGKYLADAKGAITATANDLKAGGIVMSNDRGLVTVPVASLLDTEAAAEAAPVAVSVDRILAKVFVGGTPTVTNGSYYRCNSSCFGYKCMQSIRPESYHSRYFF